MSIEASDSHFWLDRRVFVTGATGLIGGWLVKHLLHAGADIVCLLRDWVPQSEFIYRGLIDQVTVISGDVTDQALCERALGEYEISTVLHLAAQTIVPIANRNPVSTFESNIAGTWALLEACRRSPNVQQIIIASSDKAYGDHVELPYLENFALQGRHPYDVSKSCADLIAKSYAETYDLPVAITRCGNVYGGGDLNWNRIVPGTIRSILKGERPVIRSNGKSIRDYIFVEDIAEAYMVLAEKMALQPHLRGEAFNFSDELKISVLELVEKILNLTGSNLKPDIQDMASCEITNQYLSAEKARKLLSWKPEFSLDEGLSRTIRWYSDYLSQAANRAASDRFMKLSDNNEEKTKYAYSPVETEGSIQTRIVTHQRQSRSLHEDLQP